MNGLHDTSFKLGACIVILSLLVLTTVGAETPTVTRTLRVRLTVETPRGSDDEARPEHKLELLK